MVAMIVICLQFRWRVINRGLARRILGQQLQFQPPQLLKILGRVENSVWKTLQFLTAGAVMISVSGGHHHLALEVNIDIWRTKETKYFQVIQYYF